MADGIALSEVTVAYRDRARVVRFGLIALATDLTSEGDLARLLPGPDARIHGTRVAFRNPTTPENLRAMAPDLAAAARLLVPGEPLAAIVYACTAASAVIGEEAVAEAVAAGRPGVPVVTPTDAAVAALRTLGARRIAILTPYTVATTRPLVDHFARAGFTVAAAACLGLEDDREMARVETDTILAAAAAVDRPEADAIFVSCTGLPAVDAIDAIERRTGKPVVTSNQASGWAMRRLGGLGGVPIGGFGRLLSDRAAEPAA